MGGNTGKGNKMFISNWKTKNKTTKTMVSIKE